MTLYSLFKQRKFLFISLVFHIVVICGAIISIHFWRMAPKKNIEIKEVELFTPEPEQASPKDNIAQPAEIPAKKPTPTPPPEPLRSDLKENIIKKWDTIEKKNR